MGEGRREKTKVLKDGSVMTYEVDEFCPEIGPEEKEDGTVVLPSGARIKGISEGGKEWFLKGYAEGLRRALRDVTPIPHRCPECGHKHLSLK